MSASEEILWTAGFLNERFPAPVSPLGWSLVGPLFEEHALREPLRYMGYPQANTIPLVRLYHGHPYANALAFQIFYKPFPEMFVPADAVRYFPDGDTGWRRRAPYPASLLDPRLIVSLVLHFVLDPLNWSPFNYVAWDRYARAHDRRVAELNAQLDRAETAEEILSVAAGAREADARLLTVHRWSLTYADIFFKWLARLAPDSAQALISGQNNKTAEVNAALAEFRRLAVSCGLGTGDPDALARARAHPVLSAALDHLLAEHGHRAASLDIAEPTLAEEPEQVFALGGNQASSPGPRRTGDAGRDSESVLTDARKALHLWERPLFHLVLSLARRYALLREEQRYFWHKSLAVSRRAYLRFSELLRAQNVIADPSDTFFATREELEEWSRGNLTGSALAERIRDRQAEWQEYRGEFRRSPSRAYPAFLKGDVPLDQADERLSGEWRGRGVSPGVVEGRVRVILEAKDLGTVSAGEILVAPATDPAWTPVFARLGGLVLERGGILAHGAIVAREYHLPAVAAIPHITEGLSSGDWVQVDGTSGVVKRISRESRSPVSLPHSGV